MGKTKVALYGGAKNPIGLHHEQVAQSVFEITKMPVWLMPCFNHQFNKVLLSDFHRWNMTVAVASQYPHQMFACDHEIITKSKGAMWDTLNELDEKYPDIEFVPVIGMDNANCIESNWFKGTDLIQCRQFIVVNRTGVEPTTNWFLKDPHIFIDFKTSMSSSLIRIAIENKEYETAEVNLNPKVWEYIKENQLYGFKPTNQEK